jgi:hypothetical protein
LKSRDNHNKANGHEAYRAKVTAKHAKSPLIDAWVG